MPQLIKKTDLPDWNGIDPESLPREKLVSFFTDATFTLAHLYDQLNRNSTNSSQPPSSDNPWDDSNKNQSDESLLTADVKEDTSSSSDDRAMDASSTSAHKNRADERQARSQGYGRTQRLPVTRVIKLYPSNCQHPSCAEDIHKESCRCYHAFVQIDLEKEDAEGDDYYRVVVTRYELYEAPCTLCSGTTRATLEKQSTTITHVTVSARRLIGPTLASIIIMLHKENGTSIRKIAVTLKELYGIDLSTGAICAAINEGGLCCETQVDKYYAEASKADLAYMDETTWRDGGDTLWLWVLLTVDLCIFCMGRRTRKMVEAFFSKSNFSGWLMSDGYSAYRHYKKRFRCWAHLFRKAKGLSESTLDAVSVFGLRLLELMNECKAGIYAAREEEKSVSIADNFAPTLEAIKQLCEQYKDSEHDKTRALAREFLNDWAAIFRILDYPHYPLTNNEAERALRHWVILRKVLIGTQSEVGRRATCALASVIATNKRRKKNFVAAIQACITKAKNVVKNVVYRPLRLSG